MRTAFFFLNQVLSYLYKCLYEWRWALMRPNNPKVHFTISTTSALGQECWDWAYVARSATSVMSSAWRASP